MKQMALFLILIGVKDQKIISVHDFLKLKLNKIYYKDLNDCQKDILIK